MAIFGRLKTTAQKRVVSLLCGVCALVYLYRTALRPNVEHGDAYAYFGEVVSRCGALCEVGGGRFEKSKYFALRRVPVSCPSLFSPKVFIQRGHEQATAPRAIPQLMLDDFTLRGQIELKEYYFDQKYLTKSALNPVWSKELIEEWINLASSGQLAGTYGIDETNHLMSALQYVPSLRGGRSLVIGSEIPWVEAVLLAAGASSVVTLEYGSIKSEHPSITTLTPGQFMEEYLSGKIGTFDVVTSFSSVEHSGLGRYGDALNPWGDVLEIARAHCVCKVGGSLVLAVMHGYDAVEFNAHRVYSDIRYPYLASNWEQVHREEEGVQKVHVFKKNA